MTTHTLEITVDPGAAAALVAAVVAIDLVALRRRRWTISKWVRHTIRRRPAAAAVIAAALGLHLVLETDADPLRRIAGWAARQTGAQGT